MTDISNYRRYLLLGVATAGLLGLGLGVWGTQAELAGAVVAPGQLDGRARPQIIQHPDGGVIAAILVDEGDRVAAGQTVLRLDGGHWLSELALIDSRIVELAARRARLQAERDGSPAPDFGAVPSHAERGATIAGERSLFQARLRTEHETWRGLDEQAQQIHAELAGLEAQLDAFEAESQLIDAERAKIDQLVARGIAPAARSLDLQREQLRLAGRRGAAVATMARQRATLARLDVERERLTAERREHVIAELRELSADLAELAERRQALEQRIARLELKAPMAGIVHDLQVHALSSVIRPAEPVLWIVPGLGELLARARVPVGDVDELEVGQRAHIRLATLDSRDVADIDGTVARISADTLIDQVTGLAYYSADILPDPGQLDRPEHRRLVTGMPVETFIRTRSRTPLDYLLSPLTRYFDRAFRQS